MYGTVMKEKFPSGKLKYEKDPKNTERKGFYWIKAISEENWIPILPHRTKFFNNTDTEEIIFSNGTFEGLYYSDEINYFLKNNGKIKDIKYGWIYDKEEEHYYFKNFAEEM